MLSYSGVSSGMASFYQTQHDDIVSPPTNETTGGKQVPFVANPAPANEWVLKFQNIYFADAQAGTPSQPSVLIADGAGKDLLYFSVTNSASTATAKAQSITNYWMSKLIPGIPILCGSTIVSITNDAAKIFSPIEGYMKGLSSTVSTPNYEHLYSFIEGQVKSIIWTVTELDGYQCSVPTSYTVSVS
jgi:hypothetical protein